MKKISLLIASALLMMGTLAGAADSDPSDKNPKGGGAYGPANPAGDVCECNISQAGILPNNSKQYNHLLNDSQDANAPTSTAPSSKGTGEH